MTDPDLRDRPFVARHQNATVVALFAVLLGAILFAFVACQEEERPRPGGGFPAKIELNGWKLSIPEPNEKGTPTLIEPATTVSPWMVADAEGGLEFWAPAKGVTTENSDHPRTELNSLTNFPAGMQARTLRASVTVKQVPEDGEGIILGQIHGAEDISSVAYVMLRYQQETVKVIVKQVRDGDERIIYPLLEDVPLNSRFDFTISDLGNGEMFFSATHDGNTEEETAPVPAPFKGAPVRFQAGDYQLSDKPGGSRDGGRVVFHQLVEAPGATP